jgi:hypothetical protein
MNNIGLSLQPENQQNNQWPQVEIVPEDAIEIFKESGVFLNNSSVYFKDESNYISKQPARFYKLDSKLTSTDKAVRVAIWVVSVVALTGLSLGCYLNKLKK